METIKRIFPHLAKTMGTIILVGWAVATVTFVLMRVIPGGPFSAERQLPSAVQKQIEAAYHLDDPIYQQYLRYLWDAARFDFGPSYAHPGKRVGEMIREHLPISMRLGAFSLVLALLIATPLGIGAALRPGRWPDKINGIVAALGVSVPSFILGAVLLYQFAFKWRWFPPTGGQTLHSAFLPALALAAMPTAYLCRLIRSELSEVLGSEFLRTARAKGLPGWRVVIVHAIIHTLAPVFAYLGPLAAGIMTGSFVVELIFDIPGLGRFFVNSISNRNYPMIMGVTLLYTVMLVCFNMLSDAMARLLDPRLRS